MVHEFSIALDKLDVTSPQIGRFWRGTSYLGFIALWPEEWAAFLWLTRLKLQPNGVTPMILGSKPLSEMTEEELLKGIEEIRAARHALVDETKTKSAADRVEKAKKEAVKKPKTIDADVAAIMQGLMEP